MIKAFFEMLPKSRPTPTPIVLKKFSNINPNNLTNNIVHIMQQRDAVEGLYYNNPIIIYIDSNSNNQIIYFKTERNVLFNSNITLQTIMENKEDYDNLVIYKEEVNKNLLEDNYIINIDGYIRKFTFNNSTIVFNENDKPVVLKGFIVDDGKVYFNIDGGYEDFNNYLPVHTPIKTNYKVKDVVKVKSKSLILPITNVDNSKKNVRYYLGNNESVFYPAESLEKYNEIRNFEKANKTDSVALEKVSHSLGINFKEKEKVIFKASKSKPPNMTKPYYIIQSIVGKTKTGFAKTVKLIYEIGEGKTKEKSGNIDVSSLIHYDVLKEGDYVRLPDNNNTVTRKISKIGKSLFGKTKNEYYLDNNESTIYKANNLKKVDPPENNTKNNTKDNIKDKARVNKISEGDTVLYDKRHRTVMNINVKKEGPMFSKKYVTYYKLSGIPDLVKSNKVKKVKKVSENIKSNRIVPSRIGTNTNTRS
jgi:hypothetical protein